MPLYKYKCNKCSEEFEELRRISEADEEIECPECGSRDTKRKLPTSVFGGASGTSTSYSPSCGG